jgi:hypothetical protein
VSGLVGGKFAVRSNNAPAHSIVCDVRVNGLINDPVLDRRCSVTSDGLAANGHLWTAIPEVVKSVNQPLPTDLANDPPRFA